MWYAALLTLGPSSDMLPKISSPLFLFLIQCNLSGLVSDLISIIWKVVVHVAFIELEEEIVQPLFISICFCLLFVLIIGLLTDVICFSFNSWSSTNASKIPSSLFLF